MKTTLKKNSINLGIKLGIVLSTITLLIYSINLDYIIGLKETLYFFAMIGFGFYSIYYSRELQNQIISFKEVFTSYFACIAVGYLIAKFGDIVIFKLIDPAAGDLVHEMHKANALERGYERNVKFLEDNHYYSYIIVFNIYVLVLMLNSIFALIPALILKKSK